jgi:predicted nuclease of predicted toxin-antitoxin system
MPRDEWQIWLDTQISPAIAKWMSEHTGYIVKSSYTLHTNSMSDLDIYQKAKDHGKVIIISKDADFSELVVRLGSPPKLINLKIGNCRNSILWSTIKPYINNVIDILIKTEMNIVDLEQ